MKKLPIGIQTFSKIRNENFLYIDKTPHIHEMLNRYSYAFLSRPRRFGKSLLVSTMQELFEGNKTLFKDLFIYDKWNWEEKSPVIKIDFSGTKKEEDLEKVIFDNLYFNAKRLNVKLKDRTDYSISFANLIRDVHEKYKQRVVILIDEYDKPIIDNLNNIDIAVDNKLTLKRFFSNIKPNDEFIKFTFLTGVSKFSQVSIFSDLNNLTDISLMSRFGSICGYTQKDVETKFTDYLEDNDFPKLREWYNGYNFLGDKVYNPFDVLKFIDNDKIYENYWFETGTPSFLINLIQKNKYFLPNLKTIQIEKDTLKSFDVENLNIETILFQSGYLTIKKEIHKRNNYFYELDFPNFEVKNSFNNSLLNLFSESSTKVKISDDLYEIFEQSKLTNLEKVFKKLFSSIPYNNYTKNEIANYEGFYASVIYSYLASLGFELIAEDTFNKGRIDLTLKYENKVYIFEFKTNKEDPIKQIKERKYYEKYSGEIYLIGIVFNTKDRNITDFKWEKFS